MSGSIGSGRKRPTIAEQRALGRGEDVGKTIEATDASKDGALVYARCSSEVSAQNNLSIPDQLKQTRRHCDRHAWKVLKEYVDEGRSAYLDDVVRHQFEAMIADVEAGVYPTLGRVVFYHTSRFSRRTDIFASAERRLNKCGVKLVSVTQQFSNDDAGFAAKAVATVFDEMHSRQTSMHVRRAKRELVAQKRWPGGSVRRGFKVNKERFIEIDELDASLVRTIYRLAEFGDGGSPMGVKSIVEWCRAKGIKTKNDSYFGTNDIHRMLTFPGYKGKYPVNLSAVDNRPAETFVLEVPAVIDADQWERVQRILEVRDPKKGSARTVSSPLLLAGVAHCMCGAGLTLRTGTSKTGTVHRYYHCSANNRLGKSECPGQSIPEAVLDKAVLTAVSQRILAAPHLTQLLEQLIRIQAESVAAKNKALPSLMNRKAESDKALKGLLAILKQDPDLVENKVYRQELADTQRQAKLIEKDLDHHQSALKAKPEITDRHIMQFSEEVRNLLFGDNRALAKQALQSIVAGVDVTDENIVIRGEKQQLQYLVAAQSLETISVEERTPRVRGYVRRWRREWDSNPRYSFPHTRFPSVRHAARAVWRCESAALPFGPPHCARLRGHRLEI